MRLLIRDEPLSMLPVQDAGEDVRGLCVPGLLEVLVRHVAPPVFDLQQQFSDKAMKRGHGTPHELQQGWVHAIKKLGDGTVRTPWGRYGELEVEIAAAAEMSPRVLIKGYTMELIEALGLKEQVMKALTQ